MKLQFRSPHLSIKVFPAVELPPFTLITGLNGAGKSHLLQAIKLGHIAVDSAPDPNNDIRIFDWTNMLPGDTGLFDGQTLVQERAQTWQHLDNFRQQYDLGPHRVRGGNGPDALVRDAGLGAGLSEEQVADPIGLARLSEAQLFQLLGNGDKAAAAKRQIAQAVEKASELIRGQLGGQAFELDAISLHARKPIYLLERDDVLSGTIPSWGRADLFQQSFARLFVAYRDLALENVLRQLQASKGRGDTAAMSDEEFRREHKEPPWTFVNEAMRSAGLGFEIDHPDEFSRAPYQPRLTKLHGGAEVRFGNLSSGEKIMMSFALCLYYAQDRRQIASYPKVLLLDEIDAPLHPSMSRSLIRIATEVLVKHHGINVVTTTHAASTVAMAPPDAIYVMEGERPGLHRTTKADALNILTVGVPTLAFSYDGRRQVFVESPSDAEVYARVYEILKPRLASERSLEFIATGTKSVSSGSDANTGCDVVKRLVKNLVEAGNVSTYGLIDWDNTHQPSDRLVVLAHMRRDGLENVVFDPLVVAALVLRDARKHLADLGLDEKTSYFEFLGWPAEKLQPVVDRVQAITLGGKDAGASVECAYQGGFRLQLKDGYLKMDDHALEEAVLAKFPPFKAFAKRGGALMLHAVESVLQDQPRFISMEMVATFRDLLDAESHLVPAGPSLTRIVPPPDPPLVRDGV
jgi:energy-coupling factor transporter ATP-binding protein EcfA2